jgi:hypothetical protein
MKIYGERLEAGFAKAGGGKSVTRASTSRQSSPVIVGDDVRCRHRR